MKFSPILLTIRGGDVFGYDVVFVFVTLTLGTMRWPLVIVI